MSIIFANPWALLLSYGNELPRPLGRGKNGYRNCGFNRNVFLDVAVDKIMVPSNEQQFSRLNPASVNPRFIISNLGSANLRSAKITCGTDGFHKKVYNLKGDDAFNQTADIPAICG